MGTSKDNLQEKIEELEKEIEKLKKENNLLKLLSNDYTDLIYEMCFTEKAQQIMTRITTNKRILKEMNNEEKGRNCTKDV